jgi:hypothetical protein
MHHTMKIYGRAEVEFQVILNSTRDGIGCQLHVRAALTPGERGPVPNGDEAARLDTRVEDKISLSLLVIEPRCFCRPARTFCSSLNYVLRHFVKYISVSRKQVLWGDKRKTLLIWALEPRALQLIVRCSFWVWRHPFEFRVVPSRRYVRSGDQHGHLTHAHHCNAQ